MLENFPNGSNVIVTNSPPPEDKHPGFTDEMRQWLFKVVTINGVHPGCENKCCYTIKEDGGENAWNHDWLRPAKSIIRLAGENAIIYGKNGGNGKAKQIVRISDLANQLSETQKTFVSTPVLPAGTVYYSKKGRAEIVVCEMEPQVKSVIWTDFGREDARQKRSSLKRYMLAFPYVIIFCLFIDGSIVYGSSFDGHFPKCFYRVSPINSLDDKLFNTNLQNVSTQGHWLCMHPNYQEDKEATIEKQVSAQISELWNGIFTNNMSGNDDFHLSRRIHPSISSVEEWEKNTAKDPSFVLGIKWKKSDLTIRDVIKHEFGEDDFEQVKKTQQIEDIEQLADLMYGLKEV